MEQNVSSSIIQIEFVRVLLMKLKLKLKINLNLDGFAIIDIRQHAKSQHVPVVLGF